MPYYREVFLNRHSEFAWFHQGVLKGSSPVVQDSTLMTSFRARPRKGSLSSQEVQDFQADPYAYFLENITKRNYQARLAERGLPALGEPDKGHSFDMSKHTLHTALHNPSIQRTVSGVNGTSTFQNVFISHVPSAANRLDHVFVGGPLQPAPYMEVGLEGFAQGAYARVAPTAVMFDAATFSGELREGLPSVRGLTRTFESVPEFLQALGSGYLATKFGLEPVLKDLKSAGEALARATLDLTQNGNRVHRRYAPSPYTLDASVQFTGNLGLFGGTNRGFIPAPHSGLAPTSDTQTGSYPAEMVYWKKRSVRRWFEGEFTFFYPLTFDPESYLSRLDVLMNFDWSVRTLWELAPWSWMIDWFLDIEATIKSNELAGNNHLIMHYGYAMEETSYESRLSWKRTSQLPAGTAGIPLTGGHTNVTRYKKRLRANPFGFQVNPTSQLDAGQLGILGALGLTKIR